MTSAHHDQDEELALASIRAVISIEELARILRQLRRREARGRGDSPLSYRELATRTGWAHGVIGDYFAGRALAPTDRFDVLIGLLGATPAELGVLATARDRVEECRRRVKQPSGDVPSGRPHQLPALASGFVGREQELAYAHELLESARRSPDTPIVAFCGTAGVGKTALALHWAKQLKSRFPDGSLHLDLRGYGPGEPVTPVEALHGLLRGLGVADLELAASASELAARFRSLLACRRMIIVLDNVRSAEQVRPLLPGVTSSLTLVTSRDQLPGLVARDGVHRVPVHLLSLDESVQLLRRLLGKRAEANPKATRALAIRCARLPLALRVAAELAARRPASSLAALVAELGDPPRTLDLLDAGGDTETAVRQIFSWSYRTLSPGAAACFRSLGLYPGTEFEVPTLVALTGLTVFQAQCSVEELVRTNLIDACRPSRYTMHNLLRAYAQERASEDANLTENAARRLREHNANVGVVVVAKVYPLEAVDPEPPGEQPAAAPGTAVLVSGYPVRAA